MRIIEGIKDAIGIMDDIGDYTDSVSKVMNRVNVSIRAFKQALDNTEKQVKVTKTLEVSSEFASHFKKFVNVENDVKKAVSRLQHLFSSLSKTKYEGKQTVMPIIKKHIQELTEFMTTYRKTLSKLASLKAMQKRILRKEILKAAVVLVGVQAVSYGLTQLLFHGSKIEKSVKNISDYGKKEKEKLKKI